MSETSRRRQEVVYLCPVSCVHMGRLEDVQITVTYPIAEAYLLKIRGLHTEIYTLRYNMRPYSKYNVRFGRA